MRNYLGSILAYIAGTLSLLSGLSIITLPDKAENGMAMSIIGLVVLLGVFAYRSVKKTKRREVKFSWVRRTFEIVLLSIAAALILMQNNLGYLAETDPVPYVIIPLWVLLAYLYMVFRKPYAIDDSQILNKKST